MSFFEYPYFFQFQFSYWFSKYVLCLLFLLDKTRKSGLLQFLPLDILLPYCTNFHAYLDPLRLLVWSSGQHSNRMDSQPVVFQLSTVFDFRMCSLLTSNSLHSRWLQRRRNRQSSSQTTPQSFLSECKFGDLLLEICSDVDRKTLSIWAAIIIFFWGTSA